MIDINIYRARVGNFNIKYFKQSSKIPKFWLIIHAYLLNLYLYSILKKYLFINHPCMTSLLLLLVSLYYINHHFTLPNFTYRIPTYLLYLPIVKACQVTSFLLRLLVFLLLLLIISGDIETNPGPKCYFKVAHINCRSLLATSRLHDIETVLVKYHQFDIIALTETHIDASVSNHQVALPNYNIYRKDRTRFGGGVAVYCKSSIPSTRRHDLEFPACEMLWLELLIGGRKILLSSCYRPPGQLVANIDIFINNLSLSLESAIDEHPTSVLLLGDLNDRCTSWDFPHTNSETKDKLRTLCNELSLTQLIKDPTRGNNILDLIITNTPLLFIDSGVYPELPDLDHCIIHATFNITYNTSAPYYKHTWKLEQGNYQSLNNFYLNKFSNLNNIFSDTDLNKNVETLTKTILEGMELHIPSKRIKIYPTDKPWFTPELKTLFKISYRLHKRKNKTKLPSDILAFENARRHAKESFRTARDNYFQNLNNQISNPETTSKTFWKLLKSLFGKSNTGIPDLTDNNTTYSNNHDKAELLNTFFASQSTIPNPNSPLPPFNYITDARLDQINITPTDVSQVLKSLTTNKATGIDSISNKLLKECAHTLAEPLAFIFQLSLNMGVFPDSWKEALISAIFKKLDPSLTKNYRPISLLSSISKVFEKLVFNQTFPYLTKNKLLSPKNSGFTPNDGAINRIIAMLESIYINLDNHNDTLFTSIDISKAFDRVWHQGLIFKLKQMGITGRLLDWFQSYLTNRRQRVAVGGHLSSLKHTNSGVPQGSILGPMLFLVFVSDMCEGLKSEVHQFADDTTLITNFTDPIIAVLTLNHDLQLLARWADTWKVTFNPSKTLYMLITKKKRAIPLDPIYLCGEPIIKTDCITTLGVKITSDLTWSNHVNALIAKASQRLAVIKRYRKILPRTALTTLYITMVRPILEYGDVLYANILLSIGRSIEQVQRRAALACTGGYRHTSYNNLLHDLNWEPLYTRRKNPQTNNFLQNH